LRWQRRGQTLDSGFRPLGDFAKHFTRYVFHPAEYANEVPQDLYPQQVEVFNTILEAQREPIAEDTHVQTIANQSQNRWKRLMSRLRSLISLLLVVLLLTSCMSPRQSMSVREQRRIARAEQYIKEAEGYSLKKDYKEAAALYRRAHSAHSDSLNNYNCSEESKEAIIDQEIVRVFKSSVGGSLARRSIFNKFSITSQDIYQGLLRALGDADFRISFSAARALATLGDPVGKPVLEKGLSGEFEMSWLHVDRLEVSPQYQTSVGFDSQSFQSSFGRAPPTVTRFRSKFVGHNEDYQDFSREKQITAFKKQIMLLSALSLAELGEPRGRTYSLAILNSKKQPAKMRAYAAYCLSNYQGLKVIEALVKASSDRSTDVRAAVLFSLGNIGDPVAFDICIGVLKRGVYSGAVRDAVRALGKLGDPKAIPHIKVILYKAKLTSLKNSCLISLGQIGGDEALSIVKKFVSREKPEVMRTALYVVSNFDSHQAEKLLRKNLKNKDPSMRIISINGLSARFSQNSELINLIVVRLRKEKDNNVKLACIRALQGINQSDARKLIAGHLQNEDWRLRQAAILYLGQFSDKQAVGWVLYMRNDDNQVVRQTAIAVAATKIKKYPGILGMLSKKVYDSSPLVANTTVLCLSTYLDKRPELFIPVKQAARLAPTPIRTEIILNLGRIKSRYTLSVVSAHLQDHSPQIRQACALSLSYLDNPSVTSLIVPFSNDLNWQVRQTTALSLGNISSPNALKPLQTLMRDRHPFVRQSAIQAFSQVPEAPLSSLTTHLSDENWQVRLATTGILGTRINDSPNLTQQFTNLALTDNHHLVRSAASLRLSGINQPQAIDALKSNLSSGSWLIRQSAAQALGTIDSTKTIAPLATSLRDNHPLVRSAALDSLAPRVSQFPKLEPYISPLLSDRFWQVRQSAVGALGGLQKPSTDRLLTSALKDPSAFVRSSAVMSLGTRIQKDPLMVKALMNVLRNDTDASIRQLAGFSLKGVDSHQVKPVRPLIEEATSGIKAVVYIPGIDDIRPTSDREVGIATKDWPLRKTFESAGAKSFEVQWPGNLIEKNNWTVLNRNFLSAELNVTENVLKALDAAGPNGDVLIVTHSAGYFLSFSLNHHLQPGINTPITKAVQEGRIKITYLNAPMLFGASGNIDPNYKVYASPLDIISYPSITSNLKITLFKNLLSSFPSLISPTVVPNKHVDITFKFHNWHSAHSDPRVVSDMAKTYFPKTYDNIVKIDPFLWSFEAVPSVGTSFNPKFMSTPPAGFIQPPVFNRNNISFPPAGSVYISPKITGGLPYTGEINIPSPTRMQNITVPSVPTIPDINLRR